MIWSKNKPIFSILTDKEVNGKHLFYCPASAVLGQTLPSDACKAFL